MKEKMEEIQAQGVGRRGAKGSSQERDRERKKKNNKPVSTKKIIKVDTCPSKQSTNSKCSSSGKQKLHAKSTESAVGKSPSPPLMKIEEKKDPASAMNPMLMTDPEQKHLDVTPVKKIEANEINNNLTSYRDFMKTAQNIEKVQPVVEEEK